MVTSVWVVFVEDMPTSCASQGFGAWASAVTCESLVGNSCPMWLEEMIKSCEGYTTYNLENCKYYILLH